MNDKVSSWLIQLENLNKIAESNPQVAYSAYINGFQHKFTYFMITRKLREIKKVIASDKQEQLRERQAAVDGQLDPSTLRAVTMAREKGASSWLQVLPLKEQRFCLNKREFRDALMLRYNKSINDLPSNCPCGQKFSPDHAMSCKRGTLFMHSMMKFETSRPHFSRKYAMMLKESHTSNLLLGKYSLDQETLEMKQDLI